MVFLGYTIWHGQANWLPGKRFAAETSCETMKNWIGGLDLLKTAKSAENPGNFDFAARSVTLNSGYTMPINGMGTYSLHGNECINSVKAALKSGVRLFDTASAYGNEKEVGQAIREGMEELGIKWWSFPAPAIPTIFRRTRSFMISS